MKFTFTRKQNNSEGYEDFTGDNGYQNFGYEDGLGDEGDFESLHTQPEDPVENTSFASAPASVALKIVNPKGYDEAPVIADFLLNGNTVRLNVEGLAREQAIRLLDYLSGAVRMVGGMMTKVGKTTIVVAPKSVDVSSIEAMVGNN